MELPKSTIANVLAPAKRSYLFSVHLARALAYDASSIQLTNRSRLSLQFLVSRQLMLSVLVGLPTRDQSLPRRTVSFVTCMSLNAIEIFVVVWEVSAKLSGQCELRMSNEMVDKRLVTVHGPFNTSTLRGCYLGGPSH